MTKRFSVKSTLSNVLTAILAVAVMLLVIEALLRVSGPPTHRFNNQSEEYYTNPRNYHTPLRIEEGHIIYGLRYNKSPKGYRLPDEPVSDKTGKKNAVLGMGDSFTYGRGVRYEDIYLSRMEQSLSRDGYDVSVKNSAICGANIDEIYETYSYESSVKRYPVVIYGLVLNDFGKSHAIYGTDFIDFNNAGYEFDPLRKTSSLYNLICYLIEERRLHHYTIDAYLRQFEGKNAARNFETLRQLNRDVKLKGGTLIIVLFPLIYDFERYPFHGIHQKIADFCDREGILLLDLLPAFSNYMAEELWANPTDHHPNEIAHGLAAHELHGFIIEKEVIR